ncbi:protein NEL [Lucilia sericata]|uniref:protein NEL n=1 Tax=Lucilia sericata TaxID=13632 RepID=UPI0018A82804|nr:protein NEL [Lucilia sericata]XP_037819893.1 protein NEL [Lucilia sericata]
MKSILKWSLLILQLSVIVCAAGEAASPYCYNNITETTYKLVTKTRIITVKSKGFFKKLANKKETQLETYEEEQPIYKIKVERTCCDGYKLTELDLCEPQCVENGCPQHSKCVEPEVCECLNGYFSIRSPHDGKHYCEPICEKPCPENSACVAPNECGCKKGYHVVEEQKCEPYCISGCPYEGKCVAPNVCECQEGFKSEKGSCLPICSLGDQCQNGKCINKEHCVCNSGFSWNNETFKCEPAIVDEENMYTTVINGDFTESHSSAESSLELETDIDTSNDDIDPNQVFDENIETTTTFSLTDEYGSSTANTLETSHKCPDDFVYHQGQCRPLKFVSNEIDCWLKPCQDQNAVCLENGTCACNEGFKWFKTHVIDNISLNQTIKAVCLSEAEYDTRSQQLKETLEETSVEEATNWTSIFFVVVGVLIMVTALVYLGMKLVYRQRGEIDVEGKNLACAYDNRACSENDKSVI